MSKKTGGWNGYDPCESGGEAGKKWGRFGSEGKFGKSVVRRVCCLSGQRG
jgi:hypothetical protein